jgi:hypothetical protein
MKNGNGRWQSSGMLHCEVRKILTDVSEELTASIIKALLCVLLNK